MTMNGDELGRKREVNVKGEKVVDAKHRNSTEERGGADLARFETWMTRESEERERVRLGKLGQKRH